MLYLNTRYCNSRRPATLSLGACANARYNDMMTTQFIRHSLIICMLILTSGMLSGCGKKGPLYIPVQSETDVQQDKDTKKKTDNTPNEQEQ